MQTVKQIVVWLTEIVAEVLLLGCLLGTLVASQIGLLYGVIGSVLAVPVVLFLHWYYLTRALAAVVRSIKPLPYPLIAAILFVIHMHVVFVRLKPDMSSLGKVKEFPFIAGGACIVFACALAGNCLLRKWSQTSSYGAVATTSRDPTRH
jgi:hypothetical protein